MPRYAFSGPPARLTQNLRRFMAISFCQLAFYMYSGRGNLCNYIPGARPIRCPAKAHGSRAFTRDTARYRSLGAGIDPAKPDALTMPNLLLLMLLHLNIYGLTRVNLATPLTRDFNRFVAHYSFGNYSEFY